MYSTSGRAALNSGLPPRAMMVSNPDGASSRAMSIALSGLSSNRIFGAIGLLLVWFIGIKNNLPHGAGPGVRLADFSYLEHTIADPVCAMRPQPCLLDPA